MEEPEGYDVMMLEEILYESVEAREKDEIPVVPSFVFRFTQNPEESPLEDQEKLEKLLLGQPLTSKKVQESYDPLDLVQIKEFQDMSFTDKQLHNYLNDKRQYQSCKLPTFHAYPIKDLSPQLSIPTTLRLTPSYLIVGNAYGVINIYTHGIQELKTLQSSKGFGSVTSIDLSPDDNYLITGYSGGQICLWDFKTCSLLRANNSFHNTPITSFKFWKGPLSTISSDSSGKVLLIEYSKNFLSIGVNSTDILKGEIGLVADIQVLVPETEDHALDSYTICAIGGAKAVVLYTLSPDVGCFYTILRPESAQESVLPVLAWKYVQSSQTQKIYSLTVAWGTSLQVYNIKFAIPEGIDLCISLEFQNPVLGLTWMTNEVLFVSSYRKDMIVKPFSQEIIGENSRSFEIVTRNIPKDGGFVLAKSIEGVERKALIIGNKEAQYIDLLTWSQCIDELSNNGEWLDVLGFGLDLNSNKYPSHYGCPESTEELRNILEQLITIYVKVGTIAWMHKISNTIEFCVEIGSLDILFNMLLDFFVDYGGKENMDYFVNTLEPYVIAGRIKKIPSIVMGKLMAYYLRKDMPETIEKILLNLVPESIDTDQVLPIIREYKLLSAGIVVYSKLEDFLQPIVMIFSVFSSEKDLVKKKLHYYKLLWYMKMCFKSEVFLGRHIPEPILQSTLINITNWLHESPFFEAAVKQDIVCMLKVIWELFPNNIENSNDIIDKILKACENNTYHMLQFSIFVGRLIEKCDILLSYTTAVAVCKHLLIVKGEVENIPVGGSDIIAYINNITYGEQNRLAFSEYSLDEIGKTILKMLKKFPKHEDKVVAALLSLADNTQHTLVKVYLHDLQQNYIKSLNILIYCSKEQEKRYIFEWLNGKFQESSQDKLKSEVIEFLGMLVEIDSDKTAHLVRDWYQNSHSFIIKKLDNAPLLQLKYLGELLKDQFDKDLILRYVKLLCQHSPSKVLKFLKTRDFEYFEESLKICTEYQVTEAEAYLNERLGAVKEALDLWVDKLMEIREDLSRKMRKKERDLGDNILELGNGIKKYGKVCVRNSTALDLTELSDFWFNIFKICLDCFVLFKEFFYLYPQLEPTMHSSVNYILSHMLEHVNLDQIIECISKDYEEFPFKHIRDNIIEVLERHNHQKTIITHALKLIKEDTASNISHLYSSRLEGHASDFFLCRSCGKKISSLTGSVYIFACGHVFHKRCQEIPACLICNDGQFNS